MDLSRPFSAASHPARVFLLHRGLYALFAFDVWLTMISHGARYGMGGFNVTHFALLDAVVPVPTPTFYVGTLILTGLLALLHVFVGGARFLRVTVAVLFTACWVTSLFDSYQHHYLLSWILLWLACMPDVSPDSADKRDVIRLNTPFVPMLALTAGIVYSFTAVAKSEAEWRGGFVLARLSKSKPPGDVDPGALDPMRDLLMSLFGLDATAAFAWIAHSVLALQVVVALAYFLAAERDARPSHLRTFVCAAGLACALSFHAFAEIGGMFDIGWFSYYMLWLALCLLTPASFVAFLARLLSSPDRFISARVERSGGVTQDLGVLAILVLGVTSLVGAGLSADLPGATWAAGIVTALVVVWGGLQLWARFFHASVRLGFAGAVTGLCFAGCMLHTDVRFDYYRRAGGELLTLGQLEAALAMYRKADAYSGPGRSRAKQIRELEETIRAGQGDKH